MNGHAEGTSGIEVLGVQVTSSEDGADWPAFFRDLTARGLSGVELVTSDAHRAGRRDRRDAAQGIVAQ